MGGAERAVVVIEDRADRTQGHYPSAAFYLARGLAERGCRVEVLTTRGWALAGTAGPQPFTVARVSVPLAWGFDLAHRMERRVFGAGMKKGRVRTMLRETHRVLRALTVGLAIRSARRRHRDGCDVISFCFSVGPDLAAIFAGPGRTLVHVTDRVPWVLLKANRYSRFVDGRARRAEARRRAKGQGLRIVVGTPLLLEEWTARAPYLEPVLGRHAARVEAARVPNARARLGLADDARVALVFGFPHGNKDLDLVWRAFAELPDWTLLVVGRVEAAYAAWFATHGSPPAVTVGDFVDDELRAAAYSSADLVVLSFIAGHFRESAVLQEAITFGVPVVCSDGTGAADDVRNHRLGEVFAPGDLDALVEAIRRAPTALDPDDLAAARAAASAEGVAQGQLDALDALGAP